MHHKYGSSVTSKLPLLCGRLCFKTNLSVRQRLLKMCSNIKLYDGICMVDSKFDTVLSSFSVDAIIQYSPLSHISCLHFYASDDKMMITSLFFLTFKTKYKYNNIQMVSSILTLLMRYRVPSLPVFIYPHRFH